MKSNSKTVNLVMRCKTEYFSGYFCNPFPKRDHNLWREIFFVLSTLRTHSRATHEIGRFPKVGQNLLSYLISVSITVVIREKPIQKRRLFFDKLSNASSKLIFRMLYQSIYCIEKNFVPFFTQMNLIRILISMQWQWNLNGNFLGI